MTLNELSNTFDVLYNNAMNNAAPGLNEYEKSVFLTKAQDEIVKNYFNPKGNKYQEGFDGSAKRQIDFSKLISNATIALTSSNTSFDARAKVGTMPSGVLVVINEVISLDDDGTPAGTRQVIPITYNEYTQLMSRPYKEPLKNQAWRLITGQSGTVASVEVIINHNDLDKTPTYKMRYVRRPQAIILADLQSSAGDTVTIDDSYLPQDCELDESIHQEILQRAVELAKAVYATDQSGQAQMQNQITVGQRSE